MKSYTTDSALPSGTEHHARIADLIALIIETYLVLSRETDLTYVNPIVKEYRSNLAKQIRLDYTPEEVQMVMSNKNIRDLHRSLLVKLSEFEYQMELFESRRLCSQPDAGLSALLQYEDWEKYDSLVGQEIEQLSRLLQPAEAGTPIVFVGSGPLPLSAILIHILKREIVCCLDIDPDACEASTALLERIGLGNKVHVVNEDGAKFDYKSFQRVFIASLVPNKHKVLEQIRRTRPDALVAVRTVEGMRQLMYEALNEEAMEAKGGQLLARTSTMGSKVINSTLFYRFKNC